MQKYINRPYLVDTLKDLHQAQMDLELGVVEELTTEAKLIVPAINEHDAEIGDLEEFHTPVKDAVDLVDAINILADQSFRFIGEFEDIRAFRNAHSPSETVTDFVPSWALLKNDYTYDDGTKVPAGTIVWARDCDGGTSGHINWRLMCAWTEIGDITKLTTVNKTNLVDAIEELHLEHGELEALTTTDKTNFVAAINEHDKEIGDLSTLDPLESKDLDDIATILNEILTNRSFKPWSKGRWFATEQEFWASTAGSGSEENEGRIWAYCEDTGSLMFSYVYDGCRHCWNKVAGAKKMGTLELLHTEHKETIVDAINELADLCYEDEDIDFNNDIQW